MESKTIQPATRLRGLLSIPGDKSISHRSVILGALSKIPCEVQNFLEGEDCLCTIEAFRQMGVAIDQQGSRLRLAGKGLDGLHAPPAAIDCGNSGTTTRLLMGILTGQPFEVQLKGDESLSRRPMERVMEPLSKMGAVFIPGPQPGRLPLRMRGTRDVRPIHYRSPVASAQIKSAVLLAGLYAAGVTEVNEPSLSRDHTERMLAAVGVVVERRGTTVRVQGVASIRASRFVVPGDLSSAAFLIAAGLLCAQGEIVVKGVGVNPTRTGFLDMVKGMGGMLRIVAQPEEGGEPLADISVQQSRLKSMSARGELIPRAIDEIPIVAVLATQAQGETVIADAAELRLKESDRLSALCEELTKMGARLSERPDGLVIQGPTSLTGARVHSHGDHRLAMSLAVAALVAKGPTTIEDTACVDTSFPTFWSLLDSLRVSS